MFKPKIRIILILALLLLSFIGVTHAEDWQMFHKNQEHTGYISDGPIPPLKILWRYETSISVRSPQSAVRSPIVI
ncbi:MAG: hypothetical protein ACE5KT_02070 [Methanosarcinales archaeon]